jgi:hypothetical protein
MMKKLLALSLACVIACGNLPVVVQDIENIANTVLVDVMAGKPFAQVLADTGSQDATLLIAIITGIESDPKLPAATRVAYAVACAPYLTQARALAAQQAGGK